MPSPRRRASPLLSADHRYPKKYSSFVFYFIHSAQCSSQGQASLRSGHAPRHALPGNIFRGTRQNLPGSCAGNGRSCRFLHHARLRRTRAPVPRQQLTRLFNWLKNSDKPRASTRRELTQRPSRVPGPLILVIWHDPCEFSLSPDRKVASLAGGHESASREIRRGGEQVRGTSDEAGALQIG